MRNLKIKGFTLIELIVVIAIIGILTALLVPNMVRYVIDSKYADANKNAKMVFQSAATYCAEYAVASRGPNPNTGVLDNKTPPCNSADQILNVERYNKSALKYVTVMSLEESVNKYLDNGLQGSCYAVYVSPDSTAGDPTNFTVTQAFWAQDENSRYVGSYPDEINADAPLYDNLTDAKNSN